MLNIAFQIFKKFVIFLLCAILKIYGKDHLRVDPLTLSYDRITKNLWSHIVKHIFFLSCEVSFNNVTIITSIRYYKIFQSEKLSLTGFDPLYVLHFLSKYFFIKQVFKVKLENHDAVFTIFRARNFCHINNFWYSSKVHINSY